MSDGRTCWADVVEPPAGDEWLNTGAVMQQLGILVWSSPTGILEPSRGDIDVSVDKVCNWLAQECQASVNLVHQSWQSLVIFLGIADDPYCPWPLWHLLPVETDGINTKQMASDRLGPMLLWPRCGRCRLMPVDEARWQFVQTTLQMMTTVHWLANFWRWTYIRQKKTYKCEFLCCCYNALL